MIEEKYYAFNVFFVEEGNNYGLSSTFAAAHII